MIDFFFTFSSVNNKTYNFFYIYYNCRNKQVLFAFLSADNHYFIEGPEIDIIWTLF